ncbi:MAG: HNH endonuclease [Actinomycetota bacterium]|nr:HNH endonuclease [Actinomycetota bacterium]
MKSITSSIRPAAVLAAARRFRHQADAAEAGVLAMAAEWGRLHEIAEVADAATWVAAGCGDTGIPLGGEGVPLVAEFAVPELAAVLRISTDAGRALLAEALELAFRLPRLWARVQAGDLPAWRARRIAAETLCLSREAAAYVDQQVAAFSHGIGAAATQRLVDEAIARFMPDFARERRELAADGRHFDVDHTQVSFNGTSLVRGELDLADALDLDAAVSAGAATLGELGSAEPLDVRRAVAVGELARRQLVLDLTPASAVEEGAAPARRETTRQRHVVLYVHLSEQAVRSPGGQLARLENAGGQLVTADQVARWCGIAASRVVVKPVVDVAGHIQVGAYEVPDRLAEQIALRDHTCVFPWCTRPARPCRADGHGCDHDHVVPHEQGGATCSNNLAPLCRRHHRLKTHGRWRYTVLEPGAYLWSSPYGYTYLRDHTGTEDLSAGPVPVAGNPPDGVSGSSR